MLVGVVCMVCRVVGMFYECVVCWYFSRLSIDRGLCMCISVLVFGVGVFFISVRWVWLVV